MKWLALVLVAGAVVWAWCEAGCRHVDEHGISLLAWEREPGRVYGRCTQCGRRTAGWSTPWRHKFKTPARIRRGRFTVLPFTKVKREAA